MVGLGQYVAPLTGTTSGKGMGGGGSKSRKYAVLGTDDDPNAASPGGTGPTRLSVADDDAGSDDVASVYAVGGSDSDSEGSLGGAAPVDLRGTAAVNADAGAAGGPGAAAVMVAGSQGLEVAGDSAGYNGSSIAELESSTRQVLDKLMNENLDATASGRSR